MKAKEFITEGTDILYHSTIITAAIKILKSGKFELTMGSGNPSEKKWEHKDSRYYLSTSRTKSGDYHQRPGDEGVMLVLDGRWINQRYTVKPMDYWERDWLPGGRTSETEDRIYSKESSMPSTPIQAIHMLHTEEGNTGWSGGTGRARTLALLAKTKGIPLYIYNDKKAYLLQNTRKAISVKDAATSFKGSKVYSGDARKSRYMKLWIELYHKKSFKDLSPDGVKKAKQIVGQQYSDNVDFGLSNDMRNDMRPNAVGYPYVVKIEKIMRKERLKSIQDFVDMLVAKWKPINAKRVEDERAAYKEKHKMPTIDASDSDVAKYKEYMANRQPQTESIITHNRIKK